ncbi:hypothetical protein IFM89_034878 [Coptis chinensis]|uniref:Uncharacterized protein n=1 Tax=Coptis chinensis TaxID=261450 RepID=A0A835LXZ3_9MAGN|nr:hypothetical protein IFM89_034878 [Coptis chinensis]
MGTSSKHVVIVMDALKEFSYETLQWALDHVIGTGYTVTLLGVMPWLNLPFVQIITSSCKLPCQSLNLYVHVSCKTWLDVWTLDLEDLPSLRERSEWTNDAKYQKVRAIIELCDKYGVVPHMKVAMGYPLRLVVLEQTTSLHATWVVFDRHHRKNRAFYAKRIPCNVVMMNSDGEMDILNKLPMIDNGDNTPGDSPAVVPIIPRVIISEELMGILRPIREESTEEELNVDEEQGNT